MFPDGHPVPHAQVLRQLLEQAELADAVGLHAFGVGEHHRRDFAVSAPEVFLAAAAARTKNIRLGSAVTVLSSDDPIRVFQRFATVDAISDGRAEVMLGRGSFIESFPLFGLDLADYEVLFEEKLELFDKVRAQKPVHWEGRTRPAINGLSVYPPLEHHLLPAWIGVGGTPESVLRCAEYGYPIIFAIIGGQPRVLRARWPTSTARRWPSTGTRCSRSPRIRPATSPPPTRKPARSSSRTGSRCATGSAPSAAGARAAGASSTPCAAAEGALYVGSPETVAAKIALLKKNLGVDRFDLKYSNGTLPHAAMMRSIELFGTEVAPRVAAPAGRLNSHCPGR